MAGLFLGYPPPLDITCTRSHSTLVLPFHVHLKAGASVFRQVVYAATRAVVSGELPPGSPFPSVRELSQALKINPNTAHKVVSELVRDGILEVMPGIGTVVAVRRRATREEKRALLSKSVEHLVVEAKRLGLKRDDVLRAVAEQWEELSTPAAIAGGDNEPDRG
jgi:GntR family transcriptional regulator